MIDSHCHIDLFELTTTAQQAIRQLQLAGIDAVVIPGISPKHTAALLKSNNVEHFAIGLHPWFINTDYKSQLQQLEWLCQQHKPIAIGETGLDKIKGPALDVQIECLEWHCRLAKRYDLPLILHNVKALPELLQVVTSFQLEFVVHGFYGNVQQARKVLDSGGYLGIGPALLRENSKLVEVVKQFPSTRLLLESDAPFKHSHFGHGVAQVNAALVATLAKLAEELSIQSDELNVQLDLNAKSFFKSDFLSM